MNIYNGSQITLFNLMLRNATLATTVQVYSSLRGIPQYHASQTYRLLSFLLYSLPGQPQLPGGSGKVKGQSAAAGSMLTGTGGRRVSEEHP